MNVALEFEANSETLVAMAASKEAYGAEGEKARKTSGDQFKVHPEGQKPDAMFRMLAFSVGDTGGETKERPGRGCGSSAKKRRSEICRQCSSRARNPRKTKT